MPDVAIDEPGEPPPTALEAALRALPDEPLPEGLLADCLATLPSHPRRPRWAWPARLAAAALILAAAGLLFARPRPADAASLLKAVKAAWTTVPARHQVLRITRPDGVRTEESWLVRHRGLRKEVRSAGDLTGVVVRNARWEFRWDVAAGTVAAWSTELAPAHQDPGDDGLVLDATDFEAWARSHRAEIVVEDDAIGGRPARKVVLQWPGESARSRREATVWFDPKSLLPLRQRSETLDGAIYDSTIDYPAPDAVPADRFNFAMPRDVVLEVNDPDLGRQLYSEGPAPRGDATSKATLKGAER